MNAFIFLSTDPFKTPIIYLNDPQKVHEFCKENNINPNSYIDTNYNLTYSIEKSDYSICIFDIECEELHNFLKENSWEFWDIVYFIMLSNKISEFELFISILYFSEYFIQDILEEYPKALKRFIGAIKMNYDIRSTKALIKLIFGESINNQKLIKYINIEAILDSLDVIESEDMIYLFNPKTK